MKIYLVKNGNRFILLDKGDQSGFVRVLNLSQNKIEVYSDFFFYFATEL